MERYDVAQMVALHSKGARLEGVEGQCPPLMAALSGRSSYGYEYLDPGSRRQRLRVLEVLMRLGPVPLAGKQLTKRGELITPLRYTADLGLAELAFVLLRRGADPNEMDDTPDGVMKSICVGEECEWFPVVDPMAGITRMGHVDKGGTLVIIALLVAAGVNVNKVFAHEKHGEAVGVEHVLNPTVEPACFQLLKLKHDVEPFQVLL